MEELTRGSPVVTRSKKMYIHILEATHKSFATRDVLKKLYVVPRKLLQHRVLNKEKSRNIHQRNPQKRS